MTFSMRKLGGWLGVWAIVALYPRTGEGALVARYCGKPTPTEEVCLYATPDGLWFFSRHGVRQRKRSYFPAWSTRRSPTEVLYTAVSNHEEWPQRQYELRLVGTGDRCRGTLRIDGSVRGRRGFVIEIFSADRVRAD